MHGFCIHGQAAFNIFEKFNGITTNKKGIHDIADLGQGLSWGRPAELNPMYKHPTVSFILVGGQNAASGRTQKAKPEPA